MPPKKNIIKADTPENKIQVKRVIKNVKIEKPKTRTAVFKVNIPVQNIEATNELKIPKKQMTPQIRLDLANQVARAQLVKPIPETPNPPVKRKRGRMKVISDLPQLTPVTETPPTEVETPVVKKMVTRKKVPVEDKPLVTPTVKKATVPRKRLADSTVQKPPVKRTRVTKEKTLPTNNKTTTTKTQPRSKLTLSLRKRPNATQGKDQNALPNSSLNSPTLDLKLPEKIPDNNCGSKLGEGAPASVDSRKTSLTSTSSLSWTKDISDSSTTTCITVTSKDFVRIDKKLPVISVNALKSQDMKEESSSSDSDSSDSSDQTSVKDFDCDVNSHLNLSTSSISLANDVMDNKDDHIKKIGDALDKLSAKLKHFDLEMMEWIGYESQPVDADLKSFETKIFKVLKEEHEVIMHCQQLKKVLTEDTAEETLETPKESEESNFVKPSDVLIHNPRRVNEDEYSQSDDSSVASNSKEVKIQDREVFQLDSGKYMSFDQCDDDDALSLFAESISGLDSIKNNSVSSVSNYEEYIPEPIAKEPYESTDKIVYCPTKIVRNDEQNNNKAICEKQSADSTSIKELEDSALKQFENKAKDEVFASPSQFVHHDKNHDKTETRDIRREKAMPVLLASRFKTQGKKCSIFKNVCFFNLINSCKNEECRYPHSEPNINEIKTNLMWMNEVLFIEDYMMLRNWPNLRRKYGMCFVNEARRRDLTRVLVEMALDFNAKATKSGEDISLQVEVNELVLLHLNDVDLSVCADLLLWQAQRQLLCDVFMQAIAGTQNFSRFKSVFVKLTSFIRRCGRSFSLSVTEYVLERVCILPCEEPLIRAMLLMIQNTDRRILQNSMIPHFEKHLLSLGSTKLFDEFMAYKDMARVSQPVLVPYASSPQMADVEMHREREKRFTSPDTTNIQNVPRPVVPVITRTVNLSPSRSFTNVSPTLEFGPNKFQHWNKGFERKNFTPRGARRPTFQPGRNQRQVTYRHSPTNFPRRTGPKF